MLDPKVAGCKGKLAGLVAIIFVSGMAAGALTMNLAERHWLRSRDAVLTEAEKEMALQHLSQELDLNPEQAKAIEAILDEFIMQQANLLAEFKNSRMTGHEQILRVLNEDQRKRFQKVLSEINSKRRD
jgi:uncharacterized membrane protein YciS (DUF1049 family)